MTATDELSVFLGGLAAQGVVDSRGHFTLDIEKAREKLRRFQLSTPYHYVLCLLGAACAVGARTLQVHSEGLETIVEFDGQAFRFADFKDLFGAFLTPARTAVHELAMGVHGARGLDPEYIKVDSWGQGAGARLEVRGNTMEVEPLQESPFADAANRTVFKVYERAGLWVSLRLTVSQLRGHRSPVEEILAASARYAETAVRIRNQPLNVSRLGNWPAVMRINPQGPPRNPELNPRKSSFQRSKNLKVPFSGYLGFGDGPGGALVVVSGVLFQPVLATGYSTARLIVYAPYLNKDLSQSQLLQDSELDGLTHQLSLALDGLVDDVVDAGMGLADWMETPIREYFSRRVSLAEVPPTVRTANLVPLGNHQLISLENIQASYALRQRIEWINPPGYPRGQDPRQADGTLVLLRTPQWSETIERFFPQGPPEGSEARRL